MKKIISIVMLMICIINMILPVSVVNAEENTEYECIQLPIISDKSKEAVTNITLYKDNDTLYAPLHTVCPLINAEWTDAEREAIAQLFAGAIGFMKNPSSHHMITFNKDEALEMLNFAHYLLRILKTLPSKV